MEELKRCGRVKQVSKGYFHDYNELRHQGGKSWIAPKTLIREDVRDLELGWTGVELTDAVDGSSRSTFLTSREYRSRQKTRRTRRICSLGKSRWS